MKKDTAAFAQDPQTFGETLTTAGAVNGSDAVELYTARTEGCLISRLSATPMGTVTATGLVFYVQKAGTTFKQIATSVTVPAYTLVNTAKLPVLFVPEASETAPLRLGRGDKLFAAALVANASGINVRGEAQEFDDVGGA